MSATEYPFKTGKRQPHRAGGYERGSGKSWRPKASLEAQAADLLDEWSERSGMSVAWILGELPKYAQLDPETGLPPFLTELPDDGQAALFEGREAS
jgi:hypothetical protein